MVGSISPHFVPLFPHILCQYFPIFYASISPNVMPVFLHILCQYFPTFYAIISPQCMPVFLHILCQYFPTFYASISPHFMPVFPHILCQYFSTFYPHLYSTKFLSLSFSCVFFRRMKFAASSKDFDKHDFSRVLVARHAPKRAGSTDRVDGTETRLPVGRSAVPIPAWTKDFSLT